MIKICPFVEFISFSIAVLLLLEHKMQTEKQAVRRNSTIKHMQMHRLFVFAISLAISLLVSCTAKDTLPHPDAGPVTVGFRVGGEQTRTQINDDGRSTSWSKDDRIALWARNEASEFTLSAQPFQIYYRGVNGSEAYFSSTLPQAMAEGRYTYYATYPLPESLDGTKATFTIPAVQDGRVGSGADIMIATPAEASQLGPLENGPDLSLTMQHMLHVLRFYIPEGDNVLGEPVERIVLTMPQQIAGRATADITDPDGGMTLAEGGNTVELNLTEPLDASTAAEYAYACAAIFPSTQYGADDVMQVSLYSKNYAATVDDILLAGRTFAAGHVTPVPLKPTQTEKRPKLRFHIAANNLGEDVQKITLTAPDDMTWNLSVLVPDGFTYEKGDNDITIFASKNNTIGADDYFELVLYDKVDLNALEGKTITATYESQNAIVNEKVAIPADAATSDVVMINLNVPYLLQENFDYAADYAPDWGNTGNPTAVWLDDYGLNGWSGSRVTLHAGLCEQVSKRHETVAQYPGRLDSPLLPLKEGATVKVRVTFNAQRSNEYVYLTCGMVEGNELLKGNNGANSTTSITPSLNESASASNIPATDYTFEVNGATANNRISWVVERNYSFTGNGWISRTWHTYIDNIRVQIVK